MDNSLRKRVEDILRRGIYFSDPRLRGMQIIGLEKITDSILQAIRVPEKRAEGKHDGHTNDDRSWCYDCNKSAPEEEFTNNYLWNAAIDEFVKLNGLEKK